MMFAMFPQPSHGFEWVQAAGAPALRSAALAPLADHLFTTRPWRLGSASGSVDAGWADVAAAMDVNAAQLARLHQVHGAAVVTAAPGMGGALPSADIHLTRDAHLALAVQTADCLPILLADPTTGAVAAAHAGWRGLAARVPEVVVGAMERQFGCRASDLIVAIGPAIGACCYEVGGDVRDAIARAGFGDRDLARCFFDRPQATAINPSMPGLPAWPRTGSTWRRCARRAIGISSARTGATGARPAAWRVSFALEPFSLLCRPTTWVFAHVFESSKRVDATRK
jgi:Multi-copper polyphenol oxidoreductase laccase